MFKILGSQYGMGVVNEYINKERRTKADVMTLRLASPSEESSPNATKRHSTSSSQNFSRFFSQRPTICKKRSHNNFTIKKVQNSDFKNMEKQVMGIVRAQAEATNMSKIDLHVGCIKALVDSQKRVL